MKRWTHTIDIRRHYDNDTLSNAQIGERVIVTLARAKVLFGGPIEDYLRRLKQAVEEEDWDLFDLRMETIYALADEKRIWLG